MQTLLRLLAIVCAAATASCACDFCALENPSSNTLTWAKPFDNKQYPACNQYKDNACCSMDTVQGCDD